MDATAWSWPQSQILRVLDGDTVDALVTRDVGFGGTLTFSVRLRLGRINAPKLHSPAGASASQFLAQLLPVGGRFDLQTIKPYKYGGPTDQRGEFMAEITLPDGGNVSDVMVESGHAVAWDGKGPRPDDA